MQKLKRSLPLVAIMGVLFTTGLVFANAFASESGLSYFGTPVVLGEEDAEGDDEAEDKEDESDSDRDKDDSEKAGDHEDKQENDDEDQSERKTTTVRTRETTQQLKTREADDDEKKVNSEDEKDTEDANEFKEDINKLNNNIQKAESKIAVLAANGVSVDIFRSSLSEIKDLISQAEAKVVSAPNEVENIIETADHKLERLNKLVGMSLKDDDEDDESTEEATEEIQELERDITKLESELNAASARGVDVTGYRTMLNDVKVMLSQAKEKLSAGLYVEAEALAELANKKLDKIDGAIEDLNDDGNKDKEISKEYKNEVAMFVHNLKEIGDMEGGIGQQVKVVAQSQNDSKDKVENSLKEIDDRSDFVKFLIGPKYDSIADIKAAIAENETRVRVLTDLMNQLADPAVRQALQEQITILNQQNANLQKLVVESESGVSLFGWLMKLFA